MRPSTTIIGHGDTIVLPKQSQRVTAEAELAVIIGRRCKDISVDEVPAVLLGFTTVLDMTAEDILQRNPRFLTRAKSFDRFKMSRLLPWSRRGPHGATGNVVRRRDGETPRHADG